MNKQKGRVGGYFTVEASLVLPIVIGTIVFIVYVQLYLYNRCLMEQNTSMIAMQAARKGQGSIEETVRSVEIWRKQELPEGYVGWRVQEPYFSKKQNRIAVRREGYLLTDHTPWRAETAQEYRILNPAYFLRLCRRFENRF